MVLTLLTEFLIKASRAKTLKETEPVTTGKGHPMKQTTKLLALVGAIMVIGAAPVIGQPLFAFDEFGNGAFGPGVLQPDPTGGYTGGPVMVYPLPFAGTPGDGSGLGLAIAQEVVDRHAGVLEIASRNGSGGTRVRVSFPRSDSAEV